MNPALVARPLPEEARHAAPPSDLKEHATLIYSSVQGNDVWRPCNASGEAVSAFVSDDCARTISRSAGRARAHMGIAALPWYAGP